MSIGAWFHIAAAILTAVLLIAAAVSDVRRYRIPNAIVHAIVIAFLAGAAFNLPWPAIGWSALAAIGMFLLGAGLFAFGLFGGGDVKLIAAFALWTGIADLPRFLLVMTMAGGLLGAVWMARRRLRRPALAGPAAADIVLQTAAAQLDSTVPGVPPSEARPEAKAPNRIPYGVAIAVAGLDFFVTSAHSPFAPFWPWLQ